LKLGPHPDHADVELVPLAGINRHTQ
jgi:hypothetical protein